MSLAFRQKRSQRFSCVHRVLPAAQLERFKAGDISGECSPLRLTRSICLHNRKAATEFGTGKRI